MGYVNTPEVLLAKSIQVPGTPLKDETLFGHIHNVYQVSSSIIQNIGTNILNSFGLDVFYFEQIQQALMLASCLHDLGKANDQFLRALTHQHQYQQALYHEGISTWLPLRFPELGNWLFSRCSEVVKMSVLFAVLGHHLRFESGNDLKARPGSGNDKITVFCDHPDFSSCLRLAASSLREPPTGNPPLLPRTEISLTDRTLSELRFWLPEAIQWSTTTSREDRVFITLVKALLIASDVAGSAVPKEKDDLTGWVSSVLQRVCKKEDLDAIALKSLDGKHPRAFQSRVAEVQSNVGFIKAGCGSGKTTAAYLWAAKHAKGRKLFFCYPTTGTATEGFRDYILPAEISMEAALLHSRSECDLEYLPARKADNMETSRRLESLRGWDVPLVICTVDQVLGLVQNARRPLFTFPSIANGAFVFDEIHQYDDRLFGALLRFLDTFRGAPILLMTASLQSSRLNAIRQVLQQRQSDLQVIEGSPDLEKIPRYVIETLAESPPWDRINNVLEQGGKVLWVANTVDRCIKFIQEAQQRGMNPLPYHSRYRYCDRLEKHKAVIDSFKGKHSILAITTQVCEVSLNISSDLLVTDMAPVPALIQRMGRLNRRVTPEEPGHPKPAVILTPETEKPYEKEDIQLAEIWLKKLGGGPLSQAALAEVFESISQINRSFSISSEWLEGGVFSKQGILRDPEATIQVIRAEDEPLCLDENKKTIMKGVTRYSIPMLLGLVAKEINSWRRLSYVFVAPEGRINYSTELGAKWKIK